MNITVQAHHVSLPNHAGTSLADRARVVLSRFVEGIDRLDLTLKDVNGPRGGKDKVCVVRADLVDGRRVIVIDRATSLRRAIGRALQRAKGRIANELQRRRVKQRTLMRRRKNSGLKDPAALPD